MQTTDKPWMDGIDHRRQAISRNIGAFLGSGAFQIGEKFAAMGKQERVVMYIGSNLVSGDMLDFRPWQCGYPDNECLWSARQMELVSALGNTLEHFRI